ncbi:TRAP-type C4-dicarboxylate transport system, small permease component [Shimia gijangensis]|uniref:TRAP transporter small permease protein n=1 Tax=Shimia gijangensis TaxID=1470563 RepID=A0A1M6HJP2_9RHOB|nr:TRAP transporter small permease [Shimia gijangensis]SHJ22394.1 TRAP-type C4-dicarboxylate transport system, small permease component [Shimia gijangensis]
MAIAINAERRVGRIIETASRGMAIGGGILLTAMAVMTVVSIIGRMFTGFGLGPVRGDYELVANGCALAVFSFLPFCQLKRGHVTVDILTTQFSQRAQAIIGFLGDLLIAIAAIVIFKQLWHGFGEKYPYGSDAMRDALGMGYKPFFPETTYELEIPVWIPYGLALIGAAMFVVAALYTVWRSLNWAIDGQEGAV